MEITIMCARCKRPANIKAKHGSNCEVYKAEYELDYARMQLQRMEKQALMIPTVKRTIAHLEQDLEKMGSDGKRLWKYAGEDDGR